MSIQNTQRNKARRMAKHERMYPRKHLLSAPARRMIGKRWKEEAARREEEARKIRAAAMLKAFGLGDISEILNKGH